MCRLKGARLWGVLLFGVVIMSQAGGQWPLIRICLLVAAAFVLPRIFISKPDTDFSYESVALECENLSSIDQLFMRDRYHTLLDGRISFVCDDQGFSWFLREVIPHIAKSECDARSIIFIDEDVNKAKQCASVLEQTGLSISFVPISSGRNLMAHIAGVDTLVGMLPYNGLLADRSVETLKYLLQTAANHKKNIVIPDAQNMLGAVVEGDGVIPFRPGLTIGELARFLNQHALKGRADLTVVPLSRWSRSLDIQAASSGANNMAELLRSFFVPLTEVELFAHSIKQYNEQIYMVFDSVGTALDASACNQLRRIFRSGGLECAALTLMPSGQYFWEDGFIFGDISSPQRFAYLPLLLEVVRYVQSVYPEKVQFSSRFDHVLGTSSFKELCLGKISQNELKHRIEKSQRAYINQVKPYCLYAPLPQPTMLCEVFVPYER